MIQPTGHMDMDMCQDANIRDKVRTDDLYAQNLYAAMCNTEWQYQDIITILKGQRWSCSWRYAGSIISDIRGQGDYMDWYCSGMVRGHPDDDLDQLELGAVHEGTVTDEVRQDLLDIGWQQVG